MYRMLEGVRIVELSTFLAASTTGRLLAELGAEVIKVETIGGDTYRHIGPSMSCPITDGANPAFDEHNACKKFVSLNLRSEKGMSIMHELLATADVFLTNTRTQALKSMKLYWDDLKDKYPCLIFAHVLGYGEKGPRANTPGFDYTAFWARGGMMRDMAPKGSYPCTNLVGVGDHAVSLGLAGTIMGSLYRREKTGRGEKLDSSLTQMSCWLNMSSLQTAFYGTDVQRDHFHPKQALTNHYMCKDGEWIFLSCTDYRRLFAKLVTEALERPDLLEDERFNTFEASLQNKVELVEEFDKIFLTRTRDEWDEALNRADIAHEIIQGFKDVLTDPQVRENNYLYIYEYADGTQTPVTPPPIHVGTEESYLDYEFYPAKAIGADNDEYLASRGYTSEQIAEMRANGIVK